MAVFTLEDALSVWENSGKYSLFVGLCVTSIKTGTRRIIRVDELPSFVRRSSRTTEDSWSRRIMRLVPVFILETYNPTNNECIKYKDGQWPSYTRGRIILLNELGQTFVVRLVIRHGRIKTGPRRIIHVDELSSVVKGYVLNVGCVALIPE